MLQLLGIRYDFCLGVGFPPCDPSHITLLRKCIKHATSEKRGSLNHGLVLVFLLINIVQKAIPTHLSKW